MTGFRPPTGLSWRRRYSLVGGLVAAAFVSWSYLDGRSAMSLTAVFFAGLVVGAVAKRRHGTATGVGVQTGLVGGLPILWVLFDVLAFASGLSGPTWFVGAGWLMVLGGVATVGLLGFGLSALLGEAGAKVGAALTTSDPPSPTATNE
ncbi:DUF5518 domain-containing protein [Haloferax denitrificans]|uniref:Uncharacterized protein n=1 Tax=Haloferax denitrificans ATCC 35960 TaxID=662478 RepID=M0J476_9EURY|nr:DUF5518 domain-containing protein [Haloferax denitrificans]EMA03138.1 hypothetical protein C438_13976 [Haloferax denitrificans ATCC 35960]